MSSIADWSALVTATATFGTLGFLGYQSRELAKATRTSNEMAALSNQVAGASAIREAVRHYGEVLAHLVERPALRKYFFEGAPIPKQATLRAQVMVIAELIADCYDCSLVVARSLPAFSENDIDWATAAKMQWDSSPAFQEIVRIYTNIWPDLTRRLRDQGASLA